MAKDGERVVGRTCGYIRSDGRRVPAVVVLLGAGSLIDLRVGHHLGDESSDHADVAEMTARNETDVWLPGSRYRYPAT